KRTSPSATTKADDDLTMQEAWDRYREGWYGVERDPKKRSYEGLQEELFEPNFLRMWLDIVYDLADEVETNVHGKENWPRQLVFLSLGPVRFVNFFAQIFRPVPNVQQFFLDAYYSRKPVNPANYGIRPLGDRDKGAWIYNIFGRSGAAAGGNAWFPDARRWLTYWGKTLCWLLRLVQYQQELKTLLRRKRRGRLVTNAFYGSPGKQRSAAYIGTRTDRTAYGVVSLPSYFAADAAVVAVYEAMCMKAGRAYEALSSGYCAVEKERGREVKPRANDDVAGMNVAHPFFREWGNIHQMSDFEEFIMETNDMLSHKGLRTESISWASRTRSADSMTIVLLPHHTLISATGPRYLYYRAECADERGEVILHLNGRTGEFSIFDPDTHENISHRLTKTARYVLGPEVLGLLVRYRRELSGLLWSRVDEEKFKD
ncbi:hypothetical protein JCM10213_001513, partial [Rhodosporidiobolus nylandii]